LASGLAIAEPRAEEAIRVREDVETFSKDSAKVEALKLAFKTLNDSTDASKNLEFWNNIHGRPNDVSCEHGNEVIWAWHRAYLYAFETALRESHPPETSNLTLPYWDWTKPASGRRLPKIYEEEGSPLHDEKRDSQAWQQSAILPSVVEDVLSIPNWPVFGSFPKSAGSHPKGQLESQLHDQVHGFVGKKLFPYRDMGNVEFSVRDPVFWAHHANLDRLWLEWQNRWGATPVDLDEHLKRIPGNSTQREWVDVSQKYTYGPKSSAPTRGPMRAMPTAKGIAKLPRNLQELFATEIEAPLPGGTFELSEALPIVDPEKQRLILQLIDITVPPDEGNVLRGCIYIHPRDVKVTDDTDLATKYFLKHFTYWNTSTKSQHDHEHSDASKSVIFDVTSRVRELTPKLGKEPVAITIQLFSTQRGLAYGGDKGGKVGRVSLQVIDARAQDVSKGREFLLKPIQ
jgi:hypothetical protein